MDEWKGGWMNEWKKPTFRVKDLLDVEGLLGKDEGMLQVAEVVLSEQSFETEVVRSVQSGAS